MTTLLPVLFDEITESSRRRKLALALLERQRRMATTSLYYFAKYVCGFKDMEIIPHWELCHFLEKNQYMDSLVLAPRGIFKSSITTVAYPLWRLIRDPDLRFLITGGELTNSKNFLAVIKQIIEEGEVFRQLFGAWDSRKKSVTWTQTAIRISGSKRIQASESITASSYSVTKVSQHYDIAIIDDLQNEKNVTSRELIDQCDSYMEHLVPILDPQSNGKPGPRLTVGTRWHFDDTYGRMVFRERKYRSEHPGKRSLAIYDRGAGKVDLNLYVQPGTEYFPTRFSSDVLQDIRAKMTRYAFSCQYLNDPLPEGDAIFKLSRFSFFTGEHYTDQEGKNRFRVLNAVKQGVQFEAPPIINIFTTVDPAVGEEADSNYTSFVTVAVDSKWNIYVLDVNRQHLSPDGILETMFDIHDRFKPYRFGLESVLFQKFLIWGFHQKCRDKKKWFDIEELQTSNQITKEMRVNGFEPFVSSGQVFLRCKPKTDLSGPPADLYHSLLEGQDMLADEMVRYPRAGTDDCIDALSYCPQLIFPAGRPAAPKPPDNSFAEIRKRSLSRNRYKPLLRVK